MIELTDLWIFYIKTRRARDKMKNKKKGTALETRRV